MSPQAWDFLHDVLYGAIIVGILLYLNTGFWEGVGHFLSGLGDAIIKRIDK